MKYFYEQYCWILFWWSCERFEPVCILFYEHPETEAAESISASFSSCTCAFPAVTFQDVFSEKDQFQIFSTQKLGCWCKQTFHLAAVCTICTVQHECRITLLQFVAEMDFSMTWSIWPICHRTLRSQLAAQNGHTTCSINTEHEVVQWSGPSLPEPEILHTNSFTHDTSDV